MPIPDQVPDAVTHALFLSLILYLLLSFGFLRPFGGLPPLFILATNMPALVHPLDTHIVPLLDNVDNEILTLRNVLSLNVIVLHVEQILYQALRRGAVFAGIILILFLFLLRSATARILALKQLLGKVFWRLQCHKPFRIRSFEMAVK